MRAVALATPLRRQDSLWVAAAGTPIQNDLSEFHAVFDLACPGLLGTLNTFRKVYEGPIQRGRDADATEKQVGPCHAMPVADPAKNKCGCSRLPSIAILNVVVLGLVVEKVNNNQTSLFSVNGWHGFFKNFIATDVTLID
jgi:hypothetical protein